MLPICKCEFAIPICKSRSEYMMIFGIAQLNQGILNRHAPGIDNRSRKVPQSNRLFVDDLLLCRKRSGEGSQQNQPDRYPHRT